MFRRHHPTEKRSRELFYSKKSERIPAPDCPDGEKSGYFCALVVVFCKETGYPVERSCF
jgi:hypothetical protein